MLSKKIEGALNGQITNEAYASSVYLAMACWCETKGLRNATAFFYEQSAEERMHMLKLVKYINEAGGYTKISAVKEPPAKFKSLKEIFEISLAQEADYTKAFYKLVELCLAEKDFTTHSFLQWFVNEQHEEECLFQSLLDLMKLAGEESTNLLLIDIEIAKVRAAVGPGTAAE